VTETEKTQNIRMRTWIQFISALAAILIIDYAGSFLRLRIDMTEDKRYTLSAPAHKILSGLKNDVYVQVYLDGEMPVPLKRLKRRVREMLDEFRVISGRKIDYEFINPSDAKDSKLRQSRYESLIRKGLNPVNIQAGSDEGGSLQKIIFPGMIINYNGIEVPVNFLNNSSSSYEVNILRSTEGLEYEMVQTISTLSADTIYKIVFLEGHDEISETETGDITINLAKFFTIDRGTIGGRPGVLDKYAAVVIAGPEKEFSEADKFVLDQYIMKGGRVLWLFDEVAVNTDSLAFGETVGLYRPLNIEDQLFRYGARVNPAVVQDIESWFIRLKVRSGNSQQLVPVPWLYYPLLIPSPDHPVTRNLNRVRGSYTGYLDTVGMDPAITKKILLSTSSLSRVLSPPLVIRLKEAELTPDAKEFSRHNLPVAVLLEGIFPSAFRNRMTDSYMKEKKLEVRNESVRTKMIVIADADIIRNEVSRAGIKEIPLPLGQDKYTGRMFGNRDFLINCLNYLVDDRGIMELRSREMKLRLLDHNKIKAEKLKWKIVNVAGPILLIVVAGLLYNYFRKLKYTRNLA
jgi:ABC-2 type transport system permease protein